MGRAIPPALTAWLLASLVLPVAPASAGRSDIDSGPGRRPPSSAVPSPSSAYWRSCGSQRHRGAGWYHVRAHAINCRKARAVARRYFHGIVDDRSPRPLGFSCQSKRIGYELRRAACRRVAGHRAQKVRFLYGS